jgi:hypothetical protein
LLCFSHEERLTPWRESNPDCLFHRRMRWPLSHAAWDQFFKQIFEPTENLVPS